MSRPITLFSGYGQKENRTTNYCLLILKMLYEASPSYLSEVLSTLFGEEIDIGVRFQQQQRKKSGVPDGVMSQSAFTIFIEAKNFNWFYDSQLEGHLDDLSREAGQKFLLALGNFETSPDQQFERVIRICQDKHRGGIRFASVGFEELVGAIKSLSGLAKELLDTISDFEEYLDSERLLPTWKVRLDVVNCAGLPDDILKGRVYMCPATRGAYNHKRARFFGMYKNKTVGVVAEIRGMVEVSGENLSEVQWRLEGENDDELKSEAEKQLNLIRPGEYPTRIFVLGELFPTDFRKTTAPMRTSKQYFDIAASGAKSAADLAAWLMGRTWEEMPK